MSGFVLNIFGSPYAFSTAGISAVTSSDSSWSNDVTIVEGYLLPPRGWIEQIRPLSGQLQVSAQTFVIHDATVGSNSALLTALTTKKRSHFTTTRLASSISASDTSFTLENAALYSYPRVLWIGREAVHCQSRSGNVVTVASGGRGYYGSAAEPHIVDAEQNLKPTVYDGIYRLTGRGCVLWYVDDAGVLYPLWRGVIDKAATDTDGVKMRVTAKHISDVIWRLKLGVTNSACRLRGFNAAAGNGQGISVTVVTDNTSPFGEVSTVNGGIYEDLLTALQEACDTVRERLIANWGINNVFVLPAIDNGGLQITAVSYSGNTTLKLIVSIGGNQVVSTSTETADPLYAICRFESAPEVVLLTDPREQSIPVNTVAGLPTGLAGVTTWYRDLYYTRVEPFLRGVYDDDWYVEIWPTATPLPVSDDDSTIGGGPSITAQISFQPRKPDAQARSRWCDRALQMRLMGRVATSHWIYGIKAVTEEKTLWYNSNDFRNWAWPNEIIDPLVDATASRLSPRVWVFDGESTLGEFVAENAAAYGVGVGLYQSALCLRSWDAPTLSELATIQITSSDLIGRPKWSTLDEGVANSASVKTDNQTIRVNALNSMEDFTEGKEIKVRFSGAEIDRSTSDQPQEVASQLLSKAIGHFSDELQVVYLPLSWDWITRGLDVGTSVDFTEWLAPNGTGDRGNVNARGIIIYHEIVDPERQAGITIGVLVFPAQRGYAPAARVTSVSTATLTITGPGYVGGTSDFAGSDLPGYTGTPNDGGTSKFAVGDKVILLEYGNASPAYEAHTITAVDPATRHITLASSPGASMVTAISGGLVHILYNSYTTAGLQESQKQYAFVGDRSGYIDGTTDKNHVFSP